MNFYDTDFGFSTKTKKELDNIALNHNGVLGSTSYSYARPDVDDTVRHGYRAKTVGTRGMGNCGTVVLLPASREAAEMLHQGHVKSLMDEYQLEYVLADALENARKGLSYCREYYVEVAMMEFLRDSDTAKGFALFNTMSINKWRDFFMRDSDAVNALSAPRLEALNAWICSMPKAVLPEPYLVEQDRLNFYPDLKGRMLDSTGRKYERAVSEYRRLF